MRRTLPITIAQADILESLPGYKNKAVCNISGYIKITGAIDVDRLIASANEIITETTVLHVHFDDTDGKTTQYVEPDPKCILELADLASESEPEALAQNVMLKDTKQPYDPCKDDLFNILLFKTNSDCYYLYVRGHQLIVDSEGLKLFVQKVLDRYGENRETVQSATRPNPSVETQSDSSGSQHLKEVSEQYCALLEDYLRNKPEPITLSGKLPTFGACRHSIHLNSPLDKNHLDNLNRLAKKQATGLKEIAIALIALYVHKFTGENDIVVGIPIKEKLDNEIPRQVGILTCLTPLRVHIDADSTVSDFINQTVACLRERAECAHIPAKLSGLYGTIVNFDGELSFPELTGYEVIWNQMSDGPILDLSIEVGNHQSSAGLYLTLQANSANYTQRSLELHLQRLVSLFSTIQVELPDAKVSQISLLSESERDTVIYGFNDTSTDFAVDKCIHELFEDQAARNSDSIAVAFQGKSLSYSELNSRANQLARYLRQLGVGPDKPVAICVERGLDMILGLLAILKAGGAYVPMDPTFPRDRLEYMLSDSSPVALLGEAATEAHLAELDSVIPRINLSDHSGTWHTLPSDNLPRTETGVTPLNLVYIIYTSGSTGQPKGVGIRGVNLLNYSKFIVNKLPKYPNMKFASVSTIAADLGNTVVFPSLISGGELHIIGLDTATNANLYENYMDEYEIDVLKITPSHFKALFEAKRSAAAVPRKALIFGGERLTSELVDSIYELCPDCLIYNHYGPTECTIGSIMSLIKKDREYSLSIPLGYPIANSRIYILDKDDCPVPIGMVGEIYIAGAGVAVGYMNREEETIKRFKADPFSEIAGARMYKTGDLGRWLPNGMVEFLGRNDFQVKIRGFRIELGEIESALSLFPGIREIAVAAIEESSNKRLVAYYTSDSVLSTEELKEHLIATLPDYMIPSLFIRLDAMPLTTNGKIDRRSLPHPSFAANERNVIAPRTESEKMLIQEWQKILDSFKPDVSQSFISIGGDSLSYIRVSMVVEEILGWLPKNWDKLSIRDLAALKRDTRLSTSQINSTILVRAISIILVVFGHFGKIGIGGTTAALFVVSGWSFGRYQINSMFQHDSTRPVMKTIFKISLPVILYTFLLQIKGGSFHPQSLMLFDNFIDPFFDQGASFWFIDVLIQILCCMVVLFSFRSVRNIAFNKQFSFGLIGVLIALTLGYLINHYWDTDYLYNRVPHIKIWYCFLGIAIASAADYRKKFVLVGVVLLVFLVNAIFPATAIDFPLYGVIATIAIIFVERVPIPAKLTPLINKVAGATLFIYMTHFQFIHVIEKLVASPNVILSCAIAIIGGVLAWQAWEFLYHKIAFKLKPELGDVSVVECKRSFEDIFNLS